jgi:hypothetical protein
MTELSPDQLVQQLLDLPPGETEAILRRHALRIPEETVKPSGNSKPT